MGTQNPVRRHPFGRRSAFCVLQAVSSNAALHILRLVDGWTRESSALERRSQFVAHARGEGGGRACGGTRRSSLVCCASLTSGLSGSGATPWQGENTCSIPCTCSGIVDDAARRGPCRGSGYKSRVDSVSFRFFPIIIVQISQQVQHSFKHTLSTLPSPNQPITQHARPLPPRSCRLGHAGLCRPLGAAQPASAVAAIPAPATATPSGRQLGESAAVRPEPAAR